jgi:hypothetical protein
MWTMRGVSKIARERIEKCCFYGGAVVFRQAVAGEGVARGGTKSLGQRFHDLGRMWPLAMRRRACAGGQAGSRHQPREGVK